MKIGVLACLLLIMLAFTVSCVGNADPAESLEPVTSFAMDAETAPSKTETETLGVEVETLNENKVAMPEAWPKETVEATVYHAEPTEDSTAENAECTVSLAYTALLQGDRCAVDITLTINGERYTDVAAYFCYHGEADEVANLPIESVHDPFAYADIPSDAACGSYDLVVKAWEIGYEGVVEQAVTVGKREKTEFSFVYEVQEKTTFSLTEDMFIGIALAVINEGDPFILYGNDYEYNVSEAYLTKTENGETVTYPMYRATHDGELWEVQYIDRGESSTWGYNLDLHGVEAGIYDLVVSYGGSQQTFENVLRVTE